MSIQRIEFRGRGGELALLMIKWIILTLITFGIYFPWVIVGARKFRARHTYIDNEPMTFHDRGIDLLVSYAIVAIFYIIYFFLDMIVFGDLSPDLNGIDFATLNIWLLLPQYIPSLSKDILAYAVMYPVFVLATYSYMGGMHSWHGAWFGLLPLREWRVSLVLEYFGAAGLFVLSTITFGFATPYMDWIMGRRMQNRLRLGDLRVAVDGRLWDLYKYGLIALVAIPFTLGLSYIWWHIQTFIYFIERIRFYREDQEVAKLGYERQELEWIVRLVLAALACIVSLGLALPWVVCWIYRELYGHITLEGTLDPEPTLEPKYPAIPLSGPFCVFG